MDYADFMMKYLQKSLCLVGNYIEVMKQLLLFTLFLTSLLSAQVETILLKNDIYVFLKEMKVKGVIDSFGEEDPVLSKGKIGTLLDSINRNSSRLSEIELTRLRRFIGEFGYDHKNAAKNTEMFGGSQPLIDNVMDVFTDKQKHLYVYYHDSSKTTAYFEAVGNLNYGQLNSPFYNNAAIYDIGFRLRGTIAGSIGYQLEVQKGLATGNKPVALTLDPRLGFNFKFIEDIENVPNYDYTRGYVRYASSPIVDMELSIQIGRDDLRLGYGYGDRLTLGNNLPIMDFIKFDFTYGLVRFTSNHISTVGNFFTNRELSYNKYIANNRITFSLPDLFDIGIGESIIYSGRDLELAYLTPLQFYKFAEMSLQDRDNGQLWLDFQSDFLDNFEIQATFFLDENILSNFGELDKFSNKTAYQIGTYWYQPFGFENFWLKSEFTRIRPYVYSHDNPKNNFSSWGVPVGHRIGPNAQEFFIELGYHITDRIRAFGEFRFTEKGLNRFDTQGNLLQNVGSDVFIPYRYLVDPEKLDFLSGDYSKQVLTVFSLRYEPVHEHVFFVHFTNAFYQVPAQLISTTTSYWNFVYQMEY